jgi:hypothetical protein
MEVQCSNLNRGGDDTRPKYLCDYIMLTRIHYLLYSTRKNQVIHFIIPSHEPTKVVPANKEKNKCIYLKP